MQNKIIACDPMEDKYELELKCKGLMTAIYHHSKLYDDCLFSNQDEEAEIHLKSVTELGKIFEKMVEDNFDIEHKLHLLVEIQKICVRMIKEAKHPKIKHIAKKLLKMYNSDANHWLLFFIK